LILVTTCYQGNLTINFPTRKNNHFNEEEFDTKLGFELIGNVHVQKNQVESLRWAQWKI
jgi:hypothetical protein